jgi:nucleotide-binding universal stress UspA family protein
MQRALVVVEDTDAHRTLLREAGEIAAGTGADLVLLLLEGADEVDESREQYARTEGVTYNEEEVLEAGKEFITDLADDVLADLDVAYEPATAMVEQGARATEIIDTATEHDCDHVFIVGEKRSPTGKALFGDMAQAVILNFVGPVTIRTA